MKFSLATTFLLLLSSTVSSHVISSSDVALLKEREGGSLPADIPSSFSDLEKRRGGGGGGRGGGSSSSSGGSSGGKSGSGGSKSPTSGGTSSGGSGSPRYFGAGSYYPGGASVPYTAGKPSSKGLSPIGLLPIGGLAFFPGVWLYGAYAYPFHHPYYYHNHTTNQNESLPITCLCQQYSVCGCEDNNDSAYLDSLVNGTTPDGLPRNNSVLTVANVNNTLGVYINGTLSNDTTAPSSGSSILPPHVGILNLGGYWVMAVIVAGTVWFV
ncbi:hypothetical protein FQN54_006865 [Arachnomyces sp. PD_36]|nr:hypothetical protein FQN54_006865 [Arachnomyces sp. PD_36]